MRTEIPIPMDPLGDSKGNGVDDVDALILPRAAFDSTTITLWSPVTRNDIAWYYINTSSSLFSILHDIPLSLVDFCLLFFIVFNWIPSLSSPLLPSG
jgi:hypothetical protein